MKTNYLLLQVVSLLLVIASTFVNASPSVSVAFVLDESGSISASNFELETEGFQQALDSLSTGGSIEVSILGFSDSVETLIEREILTSSTYNTINSALENNTQASGGTFMSTAINAASNILQGSSAPTRIICIATDGYPNSESATITAADNAKAAGIILAPIGVALDTDGKLFLDGIASNPPVPNPADFEEFAEVVVNVCVGEVYASLSIQFTPDTVDFGAIGEQSVGGDSQYVATKYIGIGNSSSEYAYITNVDIIGNDSSSFEVLSFMLTDSSDLGNYYPISFSPFYGSSIKIAFKPQIPLPNSNVYTATLTIAAQNAGGVTADFMVDLKATIVPQDGTNFLQATILDAQAIIYEISDVGAPLDESGVSVVGESNVSVLLGDASQTEKFHRNGFVADGNARLLLIAQTQNATDAIRFEIVDPHLTEARLYPLDVQPTYKAGTRVYDDTGKILIDLNSTNTDDGSQITAVLRAGERFLGDGTEQNYSIKVCIVDEGNICTQFQQIIPVIEKRAPVVLIHGLWADETSWYDDDDRKKGLAPMLLSNGHAIKPIDYEGHLGPSETVTPRKASIAAKIKILCDSLTVSEKLACTRVDIVAHSMGGLFSRELVRQNIHNDERLATFELSFGQGAIRRLVSMGTPHYGSPLANVLWANNLYQSLTDEKKKSPTDQTGLAANNLFIKHCIKEPSVLNPGGGYDEIEDLVANLATKGKIVSTGVRDLALGSAFQDSINTFDINASYHPPVFAIAGNIGKEYDQSLTKGKVKMTDTLAITTVRFHTIGNAEKAGCYYDNVLRDNSDGIVAVGSALLSEDYLGDYNLSHYSSSGISAETTEVDGFYHTNMGKQFPFLGDNGEVNVSREDFSMIDQVIKYLSSELSQ